MAAEGHAGAGAGEFNKPRSIAIDRNDNLYVADMTGRVQKFSPDGTDRTGTTTWTGNPWHPVILEWKAEIKPCKSGSFSNDEEDSGENDDLFQLPDRIINFLFRIEF